MYKLNCWLFWEEQVVNDLSKYFKFPYSAIGNSFVCGAAK